MPISTRGNNASQSLPSSTKERRVFVRHACNLPTSCQPVMGENDQCWSGRIQNISRGGVNLLISRRFEPGTLLQIEIHHSSEKEPRSVLARVVHANAKGGEWALGCAFPWAVSEGDLQGLLAASDTILS